MEYWSEKYNQIPTFLPGEQSTVYPNAFPGLVYPTDPGVPVTLVPSSNRFSPRLGLAYSPNPKTTIRAGIARSFGRVTPLQSSSLLDSLAIVSLVSYIEKSFKIELDAFDLMIERFDCIEDIAAIIKRKQASGASPHQQG